MPLKRGPLTELDYARVLDPASQSGDALTAVLRFLAVSGGLCLTGVVAGAVLWRRHSRSKVSGHVPPARGTVSMALLGTGWAVKMQLPQFRRAGLHIMCLYSRDADRAQQLAREHCVPFGVGSPQEAIAMKAVEIISIVTPPRSRCQHFLDALEAGKHVVVDKPMALSPEEGRCMLRAAQLRPDLVAIVDHELRFTPMLLDARAALQSGALGEVLFVQAVSLAAPPQQRAWDWWADASQGGGALAHIGSHLIDALRFLLDAEVASVSAHLHTGGDTLPDRWDGRQHEVTSDDLAVLHLELRPQGSPTSPVWPASRGALSSSGAAAAPRVPAAITAGVVGQGPTTSLLTVRGQHGCMELRLTDASMRLHRRDGKVISRVPGGSCSAFAQGTLELGRALRLALGPRKDLSALADAASIADGLAVLECMDAAHQSARQKGAHIELQPHHSSAPKQADQVSSAE